MSLQTRIAALISAIGTDVKSLYAHAASTVNPHAVTKTQVGLGNVDNTSNATERAAAATLTNKTISAANNTITTAASGNLVATSLNAALAELQGDIDTRQVAATAVTKTSATGSAILPSGTTAERDGTPGVGYTRFNATTGNLETWNGSAWGTQGGVQDTQLFAKADSSSVIFAKTGSGTVSIKAGSLVAVNGKLITFSAQTAVVMPALTAGINYAIYACDDGTIRADANMSAASGYTTTTSRKIGGFLYSQTAAGTTVAGGSFATTGNGMIWTQGDVDNIAGINKFSLWDLKFRPACADPRGMVLVDGMVWVDVYLCNTDPAANGTSKAGSNIASGTVLPKIPSAFNGNGVTTYPSLNWWVANEIVRANQKRMMWEHEFVAAAFGVTENQSIDATASTYPTTQRNAGYTSKYGIEQASGHHWIWGQDSSYRNDGTATPTNYDINGNNGAGTGRGLDYLMNSLGLVRVLFGGARTIGVGSGSRASFWSNCPWNSLWNVGVRAVCDHVQLV